MKTTPTISDDPFVKLAPKSSAITAPPSQATLPLVATAFAVAALVAVIDVSVVFCAYATWKPGGYAGTHALPFHSRNCDVAAPVSIPSVVPLIFATVGFG